MPVLSCRHGHPNPPTNRFCSTCGETLSEGVVPIPPAGLAPGTPLADRYRILQEIGQGGFGRTYLAVDLNRFQERCVLKEFAPQVEGTAALQKAQELFEREAGILYQLDHPQIPQFRELLRVTHTNGSTEHDALFLVQDYVEGVSYRDLLQARLQQGLRFNESEVLHLILQLLPVLEYLHGQGVIHRDIAPDNLIQRSSDGLPVLIDFGGVKQAQAIVESQLLTAESSPTHPTRIGKVGYAPPEQLQQGRVEPNSDLYALGMTSVVLLTGLEPQALLNPQTLTGRWHEVLREQGSPPLSPMLATVLDKLLAQHPKDRYPHALAVRQALSPTLPIFSAPSPSVSSAPVSSAPVLPPPVLPPPTPALGSTTPTVEVASPWSSSPHGAEPIRSMPDRAPQPAPSPPPAPPRTAPAPSSATSPSTQSPDRASPLVLRLIQVGLVFFLLGISGALGWMAGQWWINRHKPKASFPSPLTESSHRPAPSDGESVTGSSSSQLSPEEQKRKAELQSRQTELGLDFAFLNNLVDQQFHATHPELEGQALSEDPKDEALRAEWDEMAKTLLDRLESLSPEALRHLGRYTPEDLDRWKRDVNRYHLSSRALFDLADARFFALFPDQQGKDFLAEPTGQVWQGIVVDQLAAIEAGTALETIQFARGTVGTRLEGSLKPGEGTAYIAQLQPNQSLTLSLVVQPEQGTRLSVYPPTGNLPALLEDSPATNWSGTVEAAGYYEFVIVAHGDAPVTYQLDVAVR